MADDRRYDDDDDVPFRLPLNKDSYGDDDPDGGERSENAPNIHKEDTDEIELPDDYVTGPTEAQDPMEHGTDASGNKHPAIPDPSRGPVDDDVPFHLPMNDSDERDSDVPIGHKFYTMPSDPNRHQAETLPGSDGLDPNPDFQSDHTVQSKAVPDDERYQRPQSYQAPAQAPPRREAPPPAPPQQRGNQGRNNQPLPKRRSRRRPNIGCWAIVIGVFLTFCGGLTLITTVGGAFAYARVGDLLNERIDAVDEYDAFQSTFLYDRDGRQLFEIFNEGRRTNVSYEEMPEHLINATIAIEDDSFWRNIGVDIPATTVAFLNFIGAEAGENTPGGSTITQQLVRNVLFDPEYRAERSAQRKAEEIFLAVALTGRKSKEEILELYLNEIYYGNLAYGAQAAAQVFFDKDVGELTLGEAALLAGLPQIPAELDPLSPDPTIQDAVNRRWRQVLNEMVEEEFITPAERDAALSAGLTYQPQDVPLRAPHFTVFAQTELEALMLDLGYDLDEISRGGWQVYTTVDLEINDMVQQIASEQVAQLAANNISNAAVTVISPVTGEVLAMVGSIDYNNDAIDGRVNVTTALRQPGSTMKPFTYAAAIEQGWSTSNIIWDTPVEIGIPGQDTYRPRNYDGAFHGPMRVRTALANSYNIPAVQALRYVGVGYLLEFMQRFGAVSLGTDPARYGISLTLGGGEISPLELTRAYGVFANSGVLVDTNAIRCILDNDDNIIYQYEGGCPEGNVTNDSIVRTGLGDQVLDPRLAYWISDILGDENARQTEMGAGSALFTPDIRSSVKTGTTDNVRDNWTVGYTKNLVVGVWVGNNDGDPMRNSSGLTGAAPIWNRVVTSIYNNRNMLDEFAVEGRLQSDQLTPPQGITLREVCSINSLRDPAGGCSYVSEWTLNSPAALPNGDGSLYYPDIPPAPPQQVTGSSVELVEPGIYRALVRPLPPEISNQITFPVEPGETPPPPPIYCRVALDQANDTPGVQEQWFLGPPTTTLSDAAEAETYARNAGLAFLPTIDCTPELLNAPTGPSYLTTVITYPTGRVVIPAGQGFDVTGTAQFTDQQGLYYKVEIMGGRWNNWTTIDDVKYNPVVNGTLVSLPGLEAGDYRLNLIIMGLDGNYAQNYEVAFTVQ